MAGDDLLVDYASLDRQLEAGLADTYRNNEPFAHIGLESLLKPGVAEAAAKEVAETKIEREKNNYATVEKYRLSDRKQIGPVAGAIIDELNSPKFISYLERITGIEGLLPDPLLEGGGLHRIGTGGFLKVHSDFNFHRVTKLHRRLNILVYLNPEWNEEWGGALELWDTDMGEAKASYAPLLNRSVIFTTTDESFHGHPDPLRTPPGIFRQSIALYYFTDSEFEAGHHFAQSDMTNYRERPGETFGPTYWLHQLEIRLPFVRPLTRTLKKLLKR